MTRKEMITKCVENQIARGIIGEKSKPLQIKTRLHGGYGLKPMNKDQCQKWYNETFKIVKEIEE